jgi:hypothetical protein
MDNNFEQIEKIYNEEKNKLIKKCNINDYIRIKKIFETSYKLPELQTIKHQVCHCIIMGFYIASITLTNHLLEKFLKISLIYNDAKKKKRNDDIKFDLVNKIAESNKKYDSNNLFDNINLSFDLGLITKEQKEKLLEMKNLFRNPYSHSDRRGIYKDTESNITEVKGEENADKVINGDESDLPKRDEKIFNLPFADFIFIHEFSRVNSIPFLQELDGIIRDVEEKLFPQNL